MGVWVAILAATALAAACSSEDDNQSSSSSGSGAASSSGSSSSSGSTTVTVSSSSSTSSSSSSGTGGGGAGGPDGTYRVIAIGDTGEGNAEQHCVADAMAEKCKLDGCDAVLLAGDNFYDEGVVSTDDPQWMDKFELPYDRPDLDGIPFYVVLGNHDYSPPPLDLVLDHDGDKDSQINYTFLPVGSGAGQRHSDKWTLPSAYYDAEVGGGILHLFGIDSQDTSNTQLNDMQGRVSASTASWKLAFAHHPRWTSGDHQLDNGFLNSITSVSPPGMYDMLEGIYCGVDVFLTGHDHNREYIAAGQDPACPNTHFIISGAGAKTRDTKAAKVQFSEYYDEAVEGFFYLTFSANQLVIESYDMSADMSDCSGAGAATPAFSKTLTK